MKSVLQFLRTKIWEQLDVDESRRYKSGRAVFENCPVGVFPDLVKKMQELSKEDGVHGDIFWRRRYETNVKGGTRYHNSATITTITPAAFLVGLESIELDETTDTAGFGHGIVKISNLRTPDVKFVGLPIHIEYTTDFRNGIRCSSLSLGFPIGIVSNCKDPYVRHDADKDKLVGYDEQSGKLPNHLTWPLLPPYKSYKEYMDRAIGSWIMNADVALQEASGGNHRFPPNIMEAARVWAQVDEIPRVQRGTWHHPKLTEVITGGYRTDHIKALWRAHHERYRVRNSEAANRLLAKERIRRIPLELYEARLRGAVERERNLRQEWKSVKGSDYMPSCHVFIASAVVPVLL